MHGRRLTGWRCAHMLQVPAPAAPVPRALDTEEAEQNGEPGREEVVQLQLQVQQMTVQLAEAREQAEGTHARLRAETAAAARVLLLQCQFASHDPSLRLPQQVEAKGPCQLPKNCYFNQAWLLAAGCQRARAGRFA